MMEGGALTVSGGEDGLGSGAPLLSELTEDVDDVFGGGRQSLKLLLHGVT